MMRQIGAALYLKKEQRQFPCERERVLCWVAFPGRLFTPDQVVTFQSERKSHVWKANVFCAGWLSSADLLQTRL